MGVGRQLRLAFQVDGGMSSFGEMCGVGFERGPLDYSWIHACRNSGVVRANESPAPHARGRRSSLHASVH